MHFPVTRIQVDNDELEPRVTAGDLEVVGEGGDGGTRRGSPDWALTVLTADEPWHHGLGQCQLVIDVKGSRRFRGRAVLFRSDRGRWHYFQSAGNLETLHSSELDSRVED
jgi:hypothetical protein